MWRPWLFYFLVSQWLSKHETASITHFVQFLRIFPFDVFLYLWAHIIIHSPMQNLKGYWAGEDQPLLWFYHDMVFFHFSRKEAGWQQCHTSCNHQVSMIICVMFQNRKKRYLVYIPGGWDAQCWLSLSIVIKSLISIQ